VRTVALFVALLTLLIADALALRAVLAALFTSWVLFLATVPVLAAVLWLTLRVAASLMIRFANRNAKPS
jgi:hypothetical protein